MFENVAAFGKQDVLIKKGDIVQIGTMITEELSDRYLIHNEVLNFKNFGSKSSRTRTLVIGVDKGYSEEITQLSLCQIIQRKRLFMM